MVTGAQLKRERERERKKERKRERERDTHTHRAWTRKETKCTTNNPLYWQREVSS
jgi:hypothetical protein